MRKLLSTFLVLLLILGVLQIGTVPAQASSSLKDKLIVGEVNDFCVTIDTKEEFIVIGETEDGNYLFPNVSTGEDFVAISFTTQNAETGVYKDNVMTDISSLNELKSYMQDKGKSFGKTSTSSQVVLDEMSIKNYLFFSKEGVYQDTIALSDMKTWLVNADDYKGSISATVVPVGTTSANVVIKYDFSKPKSLKQEELLYFSVIDKEAMPEEDDATEDSMSDIGVVTTMDSEDYFSEDNLISGATDNIVVKRNATYVVTMTTTQGDYTTEFTVNNIVKESESAGKEVELNNGTAPKITFSKLPKSVEMGKTIKVTMYTDKKSTMVFNGVATKEGKYYTKKAFEISENGTYYYSATAKGGKTKTGKLKVTCFKESKGEKVDMTPYFGDGTNTTTTLPQTGMDMNIWLLVGSILFIVVGVSILFRKQLMAFVGGVIHVKK